MFVFQIRVFIGWSEKTFTSHGLRYLQQTKWNGRRESCCATPSAYSYADRVAPCLTISMNKVAKALNELERETNIKRATTKEKKSRNPPPLALRCKRTWYVKKATLLYFRSTFFFSNHQPGDKRERGMCASLYSCIYALPRIFFFSKLFCHLESKKLRPNLPFAHYWTFVGLCVLHVCLGCKLQRPYTATRTLVRAAL